MILASMERRDPTLWYQTIILSILTGVSISRLQGVVTTPLEDVLQKQRQKTKTKTQERRGLTLKWSRRGSYGP